MGDHGISVRSIHWFISSIYSALGDGANGIVLPT